MRRILVPVLVPFVMLVLPACAPRWSGSLRLLPARTDLVVGVDVARGMGSHTWNAGEEATSAMASMGGAGETGEKLKSSLADFEKKTGFVWERDLLSVVVGVDLSGIDDLRFSAILHARRFDEAAWVRWYEETEKTTLKAETVDGARIYLLAG